MRLDDSPRVHEANRRHAIDQALWFLWNRAASKAHKAEEALILDLKRIHDAEGLSEDQVQTVLRMLPLIMRSELERSL